MSDSNRNTGYSFDLTMMVGGVLTAIALCVFLFFLGVKYGADSEPSKEQATSSTAKANEDTKLTCFEPVATIEKIDCLEKQIRAEHESLRADYDLAAQQQMADWALLIVIISGVQAILSLGGVYLLVRNLNLAREATVAAVESNKVAREMGQAQTRAYLSVVDVVLNFNEEMILARVNIKNSGQSPAFKVTIKGRIYAAVSEAARKTGKYAVEQRSVFGIGKESMVAANSDQKVMVPWQQVSKTKPFYVFVAKHATTFKFICKLQWVDAFGDEQSVNCTLVSFGGGGVVRPAGNVTGRASLSVVQYPEKIDEKD